MLPDRLAGLRGLFPEVFSEDKLDWDRLRAALGEDIDTAPERYSFSWAGKREAIHLLQTPTRATLTPDAGESIDFAVAAHAFVEGDNLEVLKLLYKPYFGRVKVIYIDPPYNTGNGERLYQDDYSDPTASYLAFTKQKDGQGNLLTSNPETSGRHHSAWLSMLYPRLFLARQLLTEDGVLFCSIDDHEVHHLRLLLDDIFGEENRVGTIVWKGATDNNPTQIAVEHEYILCYAYSRAALPAVWQNSVTDSKEAILDQYERLKREHGADLERIQQALRRFIKANAAVLSPLTHYDRVDEAGPYTGSRKVHNPKPGGYHYDIVHPDTGRICVEPANGYRYPETTMRSLLEAGKILFGKDETQIIQIKEYLQDYQAKLSSVIHLDSRAGANELDALFGEQKVFKNPKPVRLLRELFDFCLGPDDLLLDFFAGSCSSAHAVLEMNAKDGGRRRFIMVQLPYPVEAGSAASRLGLRTIADIGKERIRRVILHAHGRREEVAAEVPADAAMRRVGLRVFRLSASNFRPWQVPSGVSPEAYSKQLGAFVDPLAAGWSEESLLWEVVLKEGLGLTTAIQRDTRSGPVVVYQATDPGVGQSVYVCLENRVRLEDLRPLELDDRATFICRDVALDDGTAANLALQARLKVI